MGKKYIIEIPDDKIGDFIGSTRFLMPYMMAGHIGHHDTGLPIKPYTEPDLGLLAKENFERGYRQRKAEYEKEIEEIWKYAKKIAVNPVHGGYTVEELDSIFGTRILSDVFDLSASEAIEKIRQYEQEQEEIKAGDVVRVKNAPEVEIWVTYISDEDGGLLSGLALKTVGDNCNAGDTYANRNIYNFERTGEHYDVPTVLEKMRGEKDG